MSSWVTKQENWLFITTGCGDPGHGDGRPQLATKTKTKTKNSVSDLRQIPSQTGW